MKRTEGLKDVQEGENVDGVTRIDGGIRNLTSHSDSSKSSHSSPDSVGSAARSSFSGVELSHGSISMIGRRRKMEDTIIAGPGMIAGEFALFAVLDGRGGSRVSDSCRKLLCHLLAKEIRIRDGIGSLVIDWKKVMGLYFVKMDEKVNSSGGGCGVEKKSDESGHKKTRGSAAAIVMVGKEELVVAHCGGSRVVLSRGGVAMPLPCHRKPERSEERESVKADGGSCGAQGVLATSSSTGDQPQKPYVISEPQVTVIKLSESDGFLIIASDGLWNVVSHDLACEVANKCLSCHKTRREAEEETSASKTAAVLAELALAKGSKDNISVIVVELKIPSTSTS